MSASYAVCGMLHAACCMLYTSEQGTLEAHTSRQGTLEEHTSEQGTLEVHTSEQGTLEPEAPETIQNRSRRASKGGFE